MKKEKAKLIIWIGLFLTLSSCAAIPPQGPMAGGIAGGLSTLALSKTIESLPEFIPFLKVDDFEVCVLLETKFECILIVSGNTREIGIHEVTVNRNHVIITEDSFIRLISILEVYCKQYKVECVAAGETYKTIEKIFIVGDNR